MRETLGFIQGKQFFQNVIFFKKKFCLIYKGWAIAVQKIINKTSVTDYSTWFESPLSEVATAELLGSTAHKYSATHVDYSNNVRKATSVVNKKFPQASQG